MAARLGHRSLGERRWSARSKLSLVRVCREGEAWTIAAGLYLGGQRPLVVIQNTGLFESGDALRNVLFDLGLPLFALIGYRNYLVPDSPDTARASPSRCCEPGASSIVIDRFAGGALRIGGALPRLPGGPAGRAWRWWRKERGERRSRVRRVPPQWSPRTRAET